MSSPSPAPSLSFLEQLGQGKRFAGPIPSPDVLLLYEKVKPGFADRILSMAERQLEMVEKQAAHRQGIEREDVRARIKLSYLGWASGFFLGLFGLAGAMYLIHEGREFGGAAAFIASLGSLVALFAAGRLKQGAEADKKAGRLQKASSGE